MRPGIYHASRCPHSHRSNDYIHFHFDKEMELLNDDSALDSFEDSHEVVTAPLITRDVIDSGGVSELKQYGVFGKVLSIQLRRRCFSKPHGVLR